MASTSASATTDADLSKDGDELPDSDNEETEAIRRDAMREICKNLSPDPITGELEDVDIMQYVNTHTDDPNVRIVFGGNSEKKIARKKAKQKAAIANFDPAKLTILLGATWVVSLEYSGLTTDERYDDKWKFFDEEARKKREEELKGPAKQTFQMFCYIREGPEPGRGSDSRHVEQYIGLPTSQQVEDFCKISMMLPMLSCWKPCIPQRLFFTHNLSHHENALLPFLRDFRSPFSFLFEPQDMHARVRESDFQLAEIQFREYMNLNNALKDEGNEAYKRGDRDEAVAKFLEAANGLTKLLMKILSEPMEREKEAKRLLAVCLANCAAARMLVVDGEKDAKASVEDAEKAIQADPSYPKGYTRLSRAHEALGETAEAQKALLRGLGQKELENHFGLADHLIQLQTDGNGLESITDVDVFDAWEMKNLQTMNGVRGAWKRRCDDYRKSLAQ